MSQKTDGEKWYKLSGFGANVHHAIIFTYGTYIMWGMPKCDSEAPFPNWIWFKDEVCFMTVQKEMAYAVSLTIGYLCYDLLLLVFFLCVLFRSCSCSYHMNCSATFFLFLMMVRPASIQLCCGSIMKDPSICGT